MCVSAAGRIEKQRFSAGTVLDNIDHLCVCNIQSGRKRVKSVDRVFCFVGNDIIFIRKKGIKTDGRGNTDNGQKIKKNQFFLKSSRYFFVHNHPFFYNSYVIIHKKNHPFNAKCT